MTRRLDAGVRVVLLIGMLAALAVAGCSSPAAPVPTAGAAGAAGAAGSADAARSGVPAATLTGAPASLPVEVDVARAAALQSAGAFVLDVREPTEWAAGHIAGATLIPLGQLPNRLSEVPRDRQVVVVCRTGHRSAQGRDILLGAGFPGVTSMTGGMTAWTAAGNPVKTGD
jgi:rhodanese-related sulfurtransferase